MIRLRKLISVFLPILLFTSLSSSGVANAATGDTDTYFNIEANTTTSHNYAISAINPASHLTNAFTWEIWLKPTNACSGIYCHVFSKENEYVLGVVNGNFQFALNGTSGGWAWADSSIPARLNVWQHLALTRAASTSAVNMYINGNLVFTWNSAGALSTLNFADTSYNFVLGARTSNVSDANATASQSYIGSLDELKFWKVARTQAQIQSDMSTYGPTNNSDLQLYYDFNDVSGGVLVNKASGATSSSTLTIKNSPTISTLVSANLNNGNAIVTFPRTYLSANGYVLPVGVSSLSLLAVGGGGGGGNNVGNGGSGAGGYSITNYPASSTTQLAIKVGSGGAGGRYGAAGTLTYNGTTLMDGQNGDTSTVTVSGVEFSAGGGGGGQTIWADNYCSNSAIEIVTTGTAGVGIGSGGTSYTGGLGGTRSATQSTADGKNGFTHAITGTSTYYGSGGGSAAWGSYIQGAGANSLGGAGNGSNGANNTGSGGGGNAAGCLVGGYGGAGVVIFSYSAYTGTLTIPQSATYRISSSLTANVSAPGKVTFYERGKPISGCKNISTVTSSTISATCNWKPSVHGQILVNAIYVPTGAAAYQSTLSTPIITVSKRSTTR